MSNCLSINLLHLKVLMLLFTGRKNPDIDFSKKTVFSILTKSLKLKKHFLSALFLIKIPVNVIH